jgi:LysR family transcriptional regulator, transcriptional activator for dmlA
MNIQRDDLNMLLQIHKAGQLAGAARALDWAPAVVSKRLSALELRLGVRLLHRTTRRLQLTAEGEAFVEQAAALASGFDALEASLVDHQAHAKGRLRVASSPGFGRIWVAPALAALQQRHPGLSIELHLSEHLPDMTSERFDAAVWLWQPQATSLVSRKLASNRRVVVASPKYLKQRGMPVVPDDLMQHDCLVVREHDDSPALWRLQSVSHSGSKGTRSATRQHSVRVSGPLLSNHGEVVRAWALQGHGLMLRSLWDVYALIASRKLVHVLPDWAMLDADVHLVLPPRGLSLTTPRRVRLLQDHLVAALDSTLKGLYRRLAAAMLSISVDRPARPSNCIAIKAMSSIKTALPPTMRLPLAVSVIMLNT